MEAVNPPRPDYTLHVGLYNAKNNTYQDRKARNLSTNGMLICGSSCGRTGMDIEIHFNTFKYRHGQSLRLPARIVQNNVNGSVVEFTCLDGEAKCFLEHIIFPQWDGEDMYEGLLILAAYEKVTDLAGWLRLTSLIHGEYKRLCRNHHHASSAKD